MDGLAGPLSMPLDFVLTGGQRHDKTQGAVLLQGFKGDYVIADKAYATDDLLALIREEVGAMPVIPPRRNRTVQCDYDTYLYKARYLVECFINKIKWRRRLFVRYEKLDSRYLGFLLFASALIWIQ